MEKSRNTKGDIFLTRDIFSLQNVVGVLPPIRGRRGNEFLSCTKPGCQGKDTVTTEFRNSRWIPVLMTRCRVCDPNSPIMSYERAMGE
jgi:hypothetical protein